MCFWSYADEANPVQRCGVVLGFAMAPEGEVARVRADDAPANESSVLLVSSVWQETEES